MNRRLLIALALTCSLNAAHAFNITFLSDAPVSEFNDDDIEMMLDAFDHALDNNDDGVTTEWKNEKTGNHGAITPMKSGERNGRPCRVVKVDSFAKSLSGSSNLFFCKTEEGEWAITNE